MFLFRQMISRLKVTLLW